MKQEKITTPEPNTVFAGKRHRWNKKENRLDQISRPMPEFIINGREKIDLPEHPVDAKKGFHLDAKQRGVVMGLFPSDFKQPTTAKKVT